ncbi:GntR family transcriptional regulator [Helicovermis profundi]|uniref:GntR family transcriptional regulator n=1 Tax=Helicovermis profundi TaxID=3065157 RepID=A0AAU9E7P6_9FIRM|nr:GntR family transcriptional regulator [Clostridia bacterium S502]
MIKKKGKFHIKNYKPLGEVVFDYLREAILSGELKPGERLMEITLAEQLGVSRTPVREAIRKLQKEKFVEMIPRKGAYVANLTAKDIIDVLEIRIVLEGFASELASVRITDEEIDELGEILSGFNNSLDTKDTVGMIERDNEFHDKIFEATRNNKLIDMVRDLHDQFQRFRLIYFNEFDNYVELQTWHEKIYKAIKNRDSEGARINAENHVKLIMQIVLKWKEAQEKKVD